MQKSRTGKKHWQLLPLLYLSAWFPQSVFRFKEGRKKNKKKTELRCCSQARPGWQCGSYVSRETGKETATTLLLLYRSASWQLQNKRQTKAVLSFHVTVCQSRWRKWQTADLNSTFFLWIGETLIQPSKSRTVVFGGGRWAWFSCRALLYFVDPILLEQSATSSNTWFYWGEPQVWLI